MGQTSRRYNFQDGTKLYAYQLDDELDNLVQAHNTLDTDVTNHKNASVLDHPDGSVTAAKLANNAVTNSKIADGAVTANKLDPSLMNQNVDLNQHRLTSVLDHPDGSVTTAKLADNSVTTNKLANGSVTAAKVASDVATMAYINDLEVKLRMGVYR